MGITIPGKKMVRALGYSGVESGRELNYFYEEHDVPTVCFGVALVMEEILKPEGRAYAGPALRDLTSGEIAPSTVFGAILTDVRDLLKLRYRCKGLSIESAEAIDLVTNASPGAQTIVDHGLGWIINLVITALDALSRRGEPRDEIRRFRPAVIGIRDLCRAVHREFRPGAGSDRVLELQDKWEANVFKEN